VDISVPLLLIRTGRAGNRSRDLWICSQKLWPLDHRGSLIIIITIIIWSCVTATGVNLDSGWWTVQSLEFGSRYGQEFSYLRVVQTDSETNSPPFPKCIWHLSSGIKQPKHEADHSHVIIWLRQGSVRFEVFTAVTMKNGYSWVVTPCGSCKNHTA
jgi:hypothetical protein